jgi:hypothetical protein
VTNERLQEIKADVRVGVPTSGGELGRYVKFTRELIAEVERLQKALNKATTASYTVEAERDEARDDVVWTLEQLNSIQETIDNIRDGAKSWETKR